MNAYKYFGRCIELPGEFVQFIRGDVATRISYKTFASRADLSQMRSEDHPAMYRISCADNWSVGFWRSELPSGKRIYFFDWSGIEHAFSDDDVDIEKEMAILRQEKKDDRRN